MIVVTSAMMDESVIDDPGRLCLDRPRDQDLNFGLERAPAWVSRSRAQMTEIAIALLRRPNVQRACRLKLEGPYPHQLAVTFDDGAP